MAVDCGIYPGASEQPLPDQPGGGKVRIGVGGVPIAFPGDKCENNFSNCAGAGAALGANTLYVVPNLETPYASQIYLASGKCVELDSTGCSGSCIEYIQVEVTHPSTSAASGTFTYTLSAGHMLDTGYQTADVVSDGITGDYSCWWGVKFSPADGLDNSDEKLGLLDITLAKNSTFVESVSGDVFNQISIPGKYVLMLRPNADSEGSILETSPNSVFYYTSPDLDQISGSYEFIGKSGLSNEDMSKVVINVTTGFNAPTKPCPTITTNIPRLHSTRRNYRFNRCQISAWSLEPTQDGLYSINVENYLSSGSTSFFLRFYGEDETFTYQDGSTVLSVNDQITYNLLVEAGKVYYFTLQNQDDTTDRYAYNVYYEAIGGAGGFNQAIGPIVGTPIDNEISCVCTSGSDIFENVLTYPVSSSAGVLLEGAPPNPGNFPSALGVIITPDISAQNYVCPCPVTSIDVSLVPVSGVDYNPTGGKAYPGNFVSAIHPTQEINLDDFGVSCFCMSGGEKVLLENFQMYSGKLEEIFIEPGANAATDLTTLVPDITSSFFNCECNPNEDVEISVITNPTSSISVYISGGLTFDELILYLNCAIKGLNCNLTPGPETCIPITGGNGQFDYNSDSYTENNWMDYTVSQTGGISAVCIRLDGTIDGNPEEVTFRITSPRGITYDIAGTDLGDNESFSYTEITSAFNADQMDGTWKISKLDTGGDGGLGIDATSEICINPISGCGELSNPATCDGDTGDGSGTPEDPLIVVYGETFDTQTNIANDGWTYFVSNVAGTVTLETAFYYTYYYYTYPSGDTFLEYYGNDDTYSALVDSDDNSGPGSHANLTTSGETGCIFWRVRESGFGTTDFEMRVS